VNGKCVLSWLAVVAVLGTSTGCASLLVQQSPLLKRAYVPTAGQPETVQLPPVGEDSEVEIGESMVSTSRRVVYQAIKLRQPVEHAGENIGRPFRLAIPQTTLILSAVDAGGQFYSAEDLLAFTVSTGATLRVRGGVFVPSAPRSSGWPPTARTLH
jgi:hypothetical protein